MVKLHVCTYIFTYLVTWTPRPARGTVRTLPLSLSLCLSPSLWTLPGIIIIFDLLFLFIGCAIGWATLTVRIPRPINWAYGGGEGGRDFLAEEKFRRTPVHSFIHSGICYVRYTYLSIRYIVVYTWIRNVNVDYQSNPRRESSYGRELWDREIDRDNRQRVIGARYVDIYSRLITIFMFTTTTDHRHPN